MAAVTATAKTGGRQAFNATWVVIMTFYDSDPEGTKTDCTAVGVPSFQPLATHSVNQWYYLLAAAIVPLVS